MVEKIIDIAKQKLDTYDAELLSLLLLENMAGECATRGELIDASKRLRKLADAIDKVLDKE